MDSDHKMVVIAAVKLCPANRPDSDHKTVGMDYMGSVHRDVQIALIWGNVYGGLANSGTSKLKIIVYPIDPKTY